MRHTIPSFRFFLLVTSLAGSLPGAGGCDRHSPGTDSDAATTPDAANPDASWLDAEVAPDGAFPDAGPDAQPPPGIDPDSLGLELYYRFDAVLPSGYEIDNLAGPGYDLFFHQDQASVDATGPFDGALVMDNRGATYSAAAFTQLDATLRGHFHTAASIEAWTRTWDSGDSGPVVYFGFGSLFVLDGHLGCSLSIDNGNPPNSITVYYAGILATALPGAPGALEDWLHLACVYDGHQVGFYVNGELIPAALTQYETGKWLQNPWITEPQGAPVAPVTAPFDLRLGWSETFQGAVDEVAIWSVARTGDEICRDAGGQVSSGGECVLWGM